MAAPTKDSDQGKRSIARNPKATHDYHILETWEAGLVLKGTEVKSLRDAKATLVGAFARIQRGEVFLEGLHITPYEMGNRYNHLPDRSRKLLLHKKEIQRMIGAVEQKGLTLVPLELYWNDGKAKIALALGRGKKLHDKRESLKQRDAQRDLARVTRQRGRL
jgi:SsrA-binding protein